jgi:hypothetical protein
MKILARTPHPRASERVRAAAAERGGNGWRSVVETDLIRIKLSGGATLTLCESPCGGAVIVETSDTPSIRIGGQKIFEIDLDS